MIERPPTLTIDTSVARAFLDDTESEHAAVVRLFELARAGVVHLAAASSGYNLDVHFDPRELSTKLREMLEREQVESTTQLAYPGLLVPGEGAFPGAGFPALQPAWESIAASWNGPGKKPGHKDRAHIETHLLVERDVFVTIDCGLLTMCRRLTAEEGVAVEALKPSECVARYDGHPLARIRRWFWRCVLRYEASRR